MSLDEDELRAAVDEARRQGIGLTELLKRAAYLGAGTVFATQESASRLPRELVQGVMQAIERNKEEFIRAVTGSMRDWLGSLDLVELVRRAADGLDIEVNARVKLRYGGDDRPKHETKDKARAEVKRRRREV